MTGIGWGEKQFPNLMMALSLAFLNDSTEEYMFSKYVLVY